MLFVAHFSHQIDALTDVIMQLKKNLCVKAFVFNKQKNKHIM